MEALVIEQKSDMLALKKEVDEFKEQQNGQAYSKETCEAKLENLAKWLESFEERNAKIERFSNAETAEQPYFKEASYANTISVVERYQTKLRNILAKRRAEEAVEASTSKKTETKTEQNSDGKLEFSFVKDLLTSNDETSDDDQNDIVDDEPETVKVLKFQLQETKEAMRAAGNVTEQTSVGRANTLLENVKTVWAEFRIAYRTVSTKANKRYCDKMNFSELQGKYISICTKLNEIVDEAKKRSNVQLPQIKIPDFNGKSGEWNTFIGIFNRAVHHNKTLDNALRMHFLKVSVKGDAAKLINHIDPSAENYLTCYDLMKNRYDNKRLNLTVLVDKILDIPKMESENSEQLKSMHDTVWESVMQIKNYGVDVSSWGPILNHILLRKLSKTTVIDYECQRDDVKETETHEEFLKYIESRFMALEAAGSAVCVPKNAPNYVKNPISSQIKMTKNVDTAIICMSLQSATNF